ncbi:hypothetical protein EG68_00207 [Paragonimus skrjabini miyazakii]|uniref:Uncharacterized protein n=1 Tax=Paragonimus skrjabini miyazakii TaxID=59628 RepID=A0A8S9ZA55_9TREM|nr:hypothetical protein EG68_00207 [Paragonimus skrjabini miyazakii]
MYILRKFDQIPTTVHDHWTRHLDHSPDGFKRKSDTCDKPRTSYGNHTQTKIAVQKEKLLKTSRLYGEANHRHDWFILRNASLVLFILFSIIFIFLDIFYLINPASTFLGPPSQNIRMRWQNTNCQSEKNTENCNNIQTLIDQSEAGWRVMSRSIHLVKEPPEMKRACRNTSFLSTQLRMVSTIHGSKHFAENRLRETPFSQTKMVNRGNENLSFILSQESGLSVHVELTNIRLLPEYTDVFYEFSDNGIVLDTSRRSNMHHWRAPLQALRETRCRHPLPKQYYLTMHPYLDRHTTAQRRFCVSKSIPLAYEQIYQRICPDGLPHGSAFFDRSINGQCTQNKASYLPAQKNSFYCTSNTPIVNRLFGEQIVERQSYLKDTHCDTQRRLCQTCLWRSCGNNKRNIFGPKRMVMNSLGNEVGDGSEWIAEHKDKYRNDEVSSCCGVECYLSPSCLDYFSASCQAHTINHPETEEVCLQGTTLKFTLNPEFDFANNSYMCHLRYTPPRSLYTVRSWLSIKNTWQTGEISFEIESQGKFQTIRNKLFSRRYSERSLNISEMQNALQTDGRVLIWDQNIQIIYESKVKIWEDAILKQEGNSKNLKLFKLKASSEFNSQPPEIQRHREDKYLTVQFEKPFLHNTESWGNQSCQINVSHFHKSQPIYREDGGVSVSLAAPIEKDPDGAFRYKFDDSSRSTIVQLSKNMGKRSSLLRSALCDYNLPVKNRNPGHTDNVHPEAGRNGRLINHAGMELNVTSKLLHVRHSENMCEQVETWGITIEGWITKNPTYVHLLIESQYIPGEQYTVQKTTRDFLFEEDILLLPDDAFSKADNTNQKDQIHTLFRLQFDLQNVGLSLVLSLESNAARQFTAALYHFGLRHSVITSVNAKYPGLPSNLAGSVINFRELENQWHASKPWMIEAARMEDFAQSELIRQVQAITNQLADCGEQYRLASVQIADKIQEANIQSREWIDPKRDKITLRSPTDRPDRIQSQAVDANSLKPVYNQTWIINPMDLQFLTLDRTAWRLLEESKWLPYLDLIDEHLRKIRDDLDTKVIDHWAPFDRMLANLLANNWIAPARRALNATWSRMTNSPTGQSILFGLSDPLYYEEHSSRTTNGRVDSQQMKEGMALKLASFLGVPQPEHSRFTGARIWNSFSRLVPGLPTHFYYDIGRSTPVEVDRNYRTNRKSYYIDRRYMLSNEDWQYVSGGYLSNTYSTTHRQLRMQNKQLPFSRTSMRFESSNISYGFFLSLTQVRVLLLMLDGIIVLARCYQTYQFMQTVWFGRVTRVNINDLHGTQHFSYVTDGVSHLMRNKPKLTTHPEGAGANNFEFNRILHSPKYALDAEQPSDRPNSISGSLTVSKQDKSQFGAAFHNVNPDQQTTSSGLTIRSNEINTTIVEGGTSRLTACYCCLDAHYLLIIMGIGLLIIGLVLLWTTDRQIRPSWLMARTGGLSRIRALEECRLKTNVILKNLQPTYWNKAGIREARRRSIKDSERMEQFLLRFQHEKLQIQQLYLTELCTIDRELTKRQTASKLSHVEREAHSANTSFNVSTVQAIRLPSSSSCILFDSDMQLKKRVKNALKDNFFDTRSNYSQEAINMPFCFFTPVVPATLEEDRSTRILRLLASKETPVIKRINVSRGGLWNQTASSNSLEDEELLDPLYTSMTLGSLFSLLEACRRLILTSLTVIFAIGGLLACLHLGKLITQHITPIRIRKVSSV